MIKRSIRKRQWEIEKERIQGGTIEFDVTDEGDVLYNNS